MLYTNKVEILMIVKVFQDDYNKRRPRGTGASLVDQYPITLVHIVGFKMIKIRANILQVLRDEGFKVGVSRVVYKD